MPEHTLRMVVSLLAPLAVRHGKPLAIVEDADDDWQIALHIYRRVPREGDEEEPSRSLRRSRINESDDTANLNGLADAGRRPNRVIGDIIRTLEDADKPLTTVRVLADFARRRLIYSEITVKRALAKLVQAGGIVNDRHGKGYYLPDREDDPAD
jgi:hypothetical protein